MRARGDHPPFAEFIVLMAMMMSLVALSIDTMLPALPDIGRDLGVGRANDNQLIVSLLFLGMAVGQIAYGPLSDSAGRKPAMFAGLGLFILGCLLSLFTRSFPFMLVGRVLQGVGVAGPRIVSVALIRDQYQGRAMARVLSFVMAVFIVVPVIAPALGQGILIVASWRAIFGLFLVLALTVAVWFAVRQPETLDWEKRIPFSAARIASGIGEVLSTRVALGYTLAAGLVFGAFIGYLSTAQQVFQQQYGLGRLFPFYFALLSLSLGASSLTNARLVLRFGMKRLCRWALGIMAGLSILFFVFSYAFGGKPPLWTLVGYFLVIFFCDGSLYGNMNALAMEPLGHIAGVGAAVVGALSTLISMAGGTAIGQAYDGTVLPLVIGFGALSLGSIGIMRWSEAPVPKT